MAEYQLTRGADRDLSEIARYTIATWGAEQAERYLDTLERHFVALGRESVFTTTPLLARSDLRSSRCRHHYVFSVHRAGSPPLIVAVLHENMDLMKRLRTRLPPRGS